MYVEIYRNIIILSLGADTNIMTQLLLILYFFLNYFHILKVSSVRELGEGSSFFSFYIFNLPSASGVLKQELETHGALFSPRQYYSYLSINTVSTQDETENAQVDRTIEID